MAKPLDDSRQSATGDLALSLIKRSRHPNSRNAMLERQIESYLRRRYIEVPRSGEREPDKTYVEAEIGELTRVIATYVQDEVSALVSYRRRNG